MCRKLDSTVYALRISSDATESIKRIVNFLSLPAKVKKIAIKLNMCDFRLPETGAVSDPAILSALLKAFRTRYRTAEIFLVENDATSTSADVLFSYLGIDDIANTYNARIINLRHEKWVKKSINGYLFKRIDVPVLLENCDLLITHPKLKTHPLTKITCGLKNMFGCLRKKRKVIFHKVLDEAIVDVNLALKPNLAIVDANICQEGISGPAYGIPKKVGLILGGTDVVAVDAFCARLAGFRPWWVGHIRKAAASGLGQIAYKLKGDITSETLHCCKFRFNKPLYYLLKLTRRRLGGLV